MQLPKIISIEAIEKYKLKILFNDETSGIYDVSDLAGKGVFKVWEQNDQFFKVFVDKESGAISWPGGIDIDTLSAYCSIKGISPDKYFNREISHAAY
jgi:hypothetical protein